MKAREGDDRGRERERNIEEPDYRETYLERDKRKKNTEKTSKTNK